MNDDLKVLAFPQRQAEEAGDLDFQVQGLSPFMRMEAGPGQHGKQVPYLTWGMAAVCVPIGGLVDANGKTAAVMVSLPISGSMKLSELKKMANRQYRELLRKS